jgi:hypothetical protein
MDSKALTETKIAHMKFKELTCMNGSTWANVIKASLISLSWLNLRKIGDSYWMVILLPCWPYHNLHMMSLISIDIVNYFSPFSVSIVLIGEYIQYSPLINFRLIIPSNIHMQCLCTTKNEGKKHNEGNMAFNLVPRVSPSVIWERPWLRLVTCSILVSLFRKYKAPVH